MVSWFSARRIFPEGEGIHQPVPIRSCAIQPQDGTPRSRQPLPFPLDLNLSKSFQRRIWTFILLHQVLNCVLLTCLAVMYATVEDRRSVLWFLRYMFLFSQAQTFLTSVHAYVSAGFAFLALLFLYGALSMLWHSLHQGQICYGPKSSSTSRVPSPGQIKRRKNVVLQFLCKVLAAYRSFGLRGRYFSTGFFVREVVESVLQTTQAYKSSVALSNTFVNQSYGVLIFLNCFACVAITHLYRFEEMKGRLVYVLVDLTLDFAWGTIIPLVVFWPYFELFYRYTSDPSATMPFNVQREVEYIVVLSTGDFILSTFPFMSSLMNVRGVKQLLTDVASRVSEAPSSSSSMEYIVRATTPSQLKTIHAASTPISLPPARLRGLLQLCKTKVWRSAFWSKFFHGLMLLYGVAILGISISARVDCSSSPGSASMKAHECLRRVYPWLSTKVSCVGRVLHCDAAGITGEEAELTSELARFDEHTLAHLEFSGCNALLVPSAIHRFRDLSVLSIQNSELLAWGNNASISGGHFRAIQTIMFVNVTFSGLLDGLVGNPLPKSVEWISLNTVVNVEPLLFNRVGTNWEHLKYFYCDFCSISSVPVSVTTMTGLLELSLCGNALETLSGHDFFSQLSRLENFWIDGCPQLSEFPDSLWRRTASLSEFSFQNTNISEVPVWVNDIVGNVLVMYGFGTPLCANGSDSGFTAIKHLTCEEMVY